MMLSTGRRGTIQDVGGLFLEVFPDRLVRLAVEVDAPSGTVAHPQSLGRFGPVSPRCGDVGMLGPLGQYAELLQRLVRYTLAHLGVDAVPTLDALVDAGDADWEADGSGRLPDPADDVLLVVMCAEATAEANLMEGDATALARPMEVGLGRREDLDAVLPNVAVQVGQPRRVGLRNAQRYRPGEGEVVPGELGGGLHLPVEAKLLLVANRLGIVGNDRLSIAVGGAGGGAVLAVIISGLLLSGGCHP